MQVSGAAYEPIIYRSQLLFFSAPKGEVKLHTQSWGSVAVSESCRPWRAVQDVAVGAYSHRASSGDTAHQVDLGGRDWNIRSQHSYTDTQTD